MPACVFISMRNVVGRLVVFANYEFGRSRVCEKEITGPALFNVEGLT